MSAQPSQCTQSTVHRCSRSGSSLSSAICTAAHRTRMAPAPPGQPDRHDQPPRLHDGADRPDGEIQRRARNGAQRQRPARAFRVAVLVPCSVWNHRLIPTNPPPAIVTIGATTPWVIASETIRPASDPRSDPRRTAARRSWRSTPSGTTAHRTHRRRNRPVIRGRVPERLLVTTAGTTNSTAPPARSSEIHVQHVGEHAPEPSTRRRRWLPATWPPAATTPTPSATPGTMATTRICTGRSRTTSVCQT